MDYSQLTFEGKSCLTNLLEILEYWIEALDKDYGVNMVSLDYSKAFDCVPIVRLLKKVYGYRICAKVWTWIKNFLSII